VLLDGGAARLARADAFRQLLHPPPSEQLLIRCPHTPPPLQLMPELLQGYGTATQITALALWIATDPEHAARATLLARIALGGRGIEIQPDPPPPPPPSERHKLVRDALRLVLWRATGSTGGW